MAAEIVSAPLPPAPTASVPSVQGLDAQAVNAAQQQVATSGVVRVMDAPPDMVDLLNKHNAYRANHSTPALIWDSTVAIGAQEWATNHNYGTYHTVSINAEHGQLTG